MSALQATVSELRRESASAPPSAALEPLAAVAMWALGLLAGCQAFDAVALRDEVQRYVTAELSGLPLRRPPERQRKIDHLVVLYMENHAADSFFGCMKLPGFDGIVNHSIPKDPEELSASFRPFFASSRGL